MKKTVWDFGSYWEAHHAYRRLDESAETSCDSEHDYLGFRLARDQWCDDSQPADHVNSETVRGQDSRSIAGPSNEILRMAAGKVGFARQVGFRLVYDHDVMEGT